MSDLISELSEEERRRLRELSEGVAAYKNEDPGKIQLRLQEGLTRAVFFTKAFWEEAIRALRRFQSD